MVLEHTAADIRHLREALAADEDWSVSSCVQGQAFNRCEVRNAVRGVLDVCERAAGVAASTGQGGTALVPVDDVLGALRGLAS